MHTSSSAGRSRGTIRRFAAAQPGIPISKHLSGRYSTTGGSAQTRTQTQATGIHSAPVLEKMSRRAAIGRGQRHRDRSRRRRPAAARHAAEGRRRHPVRRRPVRGTGPAGPDTGLLTCEGRPRSVSGPSRVGHRPGPAGRQSRRVPVSRPESSGHGRMRRRRSARLPSPKSFETGAVPTGCGARAKIPGAAAGAPSSRAPAAANGTTCPESDSVADARQERLGVLAFGRRRGSSPIDVGGSGWGDRRRFHGSGEQGGLHDHLGHFRSRRIEPGETCRRMACRTPLQRTGESPPDNGRRNS